MGLKDIGATLPPGFRFFPSDEELVCHYLYKKIRNEQVLKGTLVEIDLHTCEPWQLPEVAKLNPNEWYFFSFRDRKYATGFRTNRATATGYWKATGKDRTVLDPRSGEIVGMRKTLVFYRHRAPNGIKTGWIMHEFRLENPHMPPKEDWVLCRVMHKSQGENGIPQFIFDTTLPTEQTMSCNYNTVTTLPSTTVPEQNQGHGNDVSLQDLQFVVQDDQNATNDQRTEISTKNEDAYGLLWDMDLEEHSFGNGVASNLDIEMRFNMDNTSIWSFSK